jgi:hypothetical protein
MAIAGTVAVVLAQPFRDDGATEASFSHYVSPLISASVPIAVGAALLARRWSGLLTLCLGSLVAGTVGGALYAMQSGADIWLGRDRGDIALAGFVNAVPLLLPLGLVTYGLVTLVAHAIERPSDLS